MHLNGWRLYVVIGLALFGAVCLGLTIFAGVFVLIAFS